MDAPYKSRLFNFLNRQVVLGRDRIDSSVRHLQVAIVWSIQILVYPVYLLVQTGRLIGRQLGSKMSQAVRQLAALRDSTDAVALEDARSQLSNAESLLEATATDAPILRILDAIAPWMRESIQFSELNAAPGVLAPIAPSEESLATRDEIALQKPSEKITAVTIRGIASCLQARKLVLVAADNQIIDILTPEQQAQLQRRMILEIASWKRDRKVLQEAILAFRVPSDAANDNRVLLPARWFWRVMGWVQQSPVAIAINLFQESALAVRSIPPAHPERLEELPQGPEVLKLPPLSSLVEPVDRAFARLEVQLGESRLVRAIEERPIPIPWLDKMNIPLERQNPDSDPWTIQALIRAAIDYFFGSESEDSTLSSPTDASQNPLPENNQPAFAAPPNRSATVLTGLPERNSALLPTADFEEDIWLSWDDLYSDSPETPQTENPADDTVPASLPAVPPTPALNATPEYRAIAGVRSRNEIAPSLPGKLSVPQPPQKHPAKHKSSPPASTPQPRGKNLVRSRPERSEAKLPRRYAAISAPSLENSATEDPAADWLEVEAAPVGYVKHPLEQILEWLDRFMFWVEEVLLSIWRWIYRRIP